MASGQPAGQRSSNQHRPGYLALTGCYGVLCRPILPRLILPRLMILRSPGRGQGQDRGPAPLGPAPPRPGQGPQAAADARLTCFHDGQRGPLTSPPPPRSRRSARRRPHRRRTARPRCRAAPRARRPDARPKRPLRPAVQLSFRAPTHEWKLRLRSSRRASWEV